MGGRGKNLSEGVPKIRSNYYPIYCKRVFKTKTAYRIVNCRGRVCLPEPTVTTLGVICKANCFRTSEPRLYRQNNSIINALLPEKLQIVADKYKN